MGLEKGTGIEQKENLLYSNTPGWIKVAVGRTGEKFWSTLGKCTRTHVCVCVCVLLKERIVRDDYH